MNNEESSRFWISWRPGAPGQPDTLESALNTQGEIEAALCQGISHFVQEYMGRAPKDIHAHLIGNHLVICLHGVLTASERQLAQSLPAEKGRTLLKQVRTNLIETARPMLEVPIQEVTGVPVLSLHHDVSTVTGEEIILFTLAESPLYRQAHNKKPGFGGTRPAGLSILVEEGCRRRKVRPLGPAPASTETTIPVRTLPAFSLGCLGPAGI